MALFQLPGQLAWLECAGGGRVDTSCCDDAVEEGRKYDLARRYADYHIFVGSLLPDPKFVSEDMGEALGECSGLSFGQFIGRICGFGV